MKRILTEARCSRMIYMFVKRYKVYAIYVTNCPFTYTIYMSPSNKEYGKLKFEIFFINIQNVISETF